MSADESPQAASPERKRRSWRVRWSLRTLAGFVFLFALILMVLTHWHRTGQQHEAVAENFYNQQWGMVEWRYQFPVMPINQIPNWETRGVVGIYRIGSPSLSPWVIRLGGEPMFQRIERIQLGEHLAPREIDAAISQIIRLGKVRNLSFYNVAITEEQLTLLLEHVDCETLFLESAKVGRGRLPFLARRDLESLVIVRTQFSNPAIDDLPLSLEYLDATRTRINDDGLDKFVRLKNLKTLKLPRTPTTEEGIENLRRKMPWCEIQWRPLTYL